MPHVAPLDVGYTLPYTLSTGGVPKLIDNSESAGTRGRVPAPLHSHRREARLRADANRGEAETGPVLDRLTGDGFPALNEADLTPPLRQNGGCDGQTAGPE